MASALCVNPMAATAAASLATSSAAAKPAPSFTEVAPPKAVKVSAVVRRRKGAGFVSAHGRSSRLAVRARAREQLCATQTEGKAQHSNAEGEEGRGWIPVVPLSALPRGERRLVRQGGETILLLWHNDEVYGIQDTTSPAEGFLNAELTQDGCIVCPSTDTTFDLKTGAVKDWCPTNPVLRFLTRPVRKLQTYPVRMDSGYIYVDLKKNGGEPAELIVSGATQARKTTTNVAAEKTKARILEAVEQELEAGGFGFGFASTSETSTGRAAATGFAALLVIELVTGVGTWTRAAYSLPFFSPPPVDQPPPPTIVVPAPAPVVPNFPSLPNVVPNFPSLPNVVPNFPNLVAPEILPSGVRYQLTTLPVDRSLVSDGDTLNVYVDVASDVASAGPVPTTVLQAVDARRVALAQRDDKAADALRKQIEKSGYKVFDAQFGRPEVLAHKYRVRLRGVDAPERQMPYGIESRDFFAGLVDGKPLRVLVYNTDLYGRAVADVYVQGTFVQETLLRSGTVWHYLAYDKRPEFTQWEQQARQSHVGLWAQPNPQEPWEFRKAKRAASQDNVEMWSISGACKQARYYRIMWSFSNFQTHGTGYNRLG